jgi:bifunctional DNA-binding transcriptional regulator/antitoxin component of YhaV-PrlF toxin-antitoxin module
MRTRISSKGQVVLPAELQQHDNISASDGCEIERLEAGEFGLVRQQRRANQALVDWLFACPEKGYFVPIASESTDDM